MSRGQTPEYFRTYYAANRDRILARQRERQPLNRDRNRIRQQRFRHGMRPEDWSAMWAAQDGRCYLCGEELAVGKADIDHDHSCCGPERSCPVCRRGLACHQCNVTIGQARDNPVLLRRMADALEAANREVAERMANRETAEQLTLL
jgi:hypothetical protein